MLAEVTATRINARLDARQQIVQGRTPSAVVYYIDLGEHIKIGFTTSLDRRLSALRVDREQLLAYEPGGRDLEKQRHREFKAERLGQRENFRKSERLMRHIEATVETYPLKGWLRLPTTNTVTVRRIS